MKIVYDIATLKQSLLPYYKKHRVAFVPTMGNLHSGHLQLIQNAKEVAEKVIISIFVNPLQFGPTEDFSSYPRTLDEDIQKLQNLNVDILFAPTTQEIYPALDSHSQVSVPQISDDLCGIFRPHFFYGVTTVVAKLFNIVQPDVALFGEKDYQQLLIIKKMVRDLCFPIEILSVPTVREAEGLAMSSRNQYLTIVERKKASSIYKTLCSIRDSILDGNKQYEQLMTEATESLTNQGFKTDYVSIRNKLNLALPSENDKELIILIAAWIGKARLVDNLSLSIPHQRKPLSLAGEGQGEAI